MIEEKENDKEPGMIRSAPVFQNHLKIKSFAIALVYILQTDADHQQFISNKPKRAANC